MSLTGADGLQGMGLARTLLMRPADHAASSGIHRMSGDTIAANTPIICSPSAPASLWRGSPRVG
jgi:hypothetical protein